MEEDEIRVAAVFEGGAFRPTEEIKLAPGTQVILTISSVKAQAKDKGWDIVAKPTLFVPTETNYLVIPEDADLREVAVNYWPKEGAAATKVRRRSVAKVPTRSQPTDDADLLIMDDVDSLQN